MTPPPTREPISAGGPLALSIIMGVLIGALAGQPTIGFFIGLGIGLVILITVWLNDRKRDL